MISKLHRLLHDRQFWLYGIIGLSGATIDFVLYVVFYKYVGIPPVFASFLSISIGIVNNFILNSRHNFKVSDALMKRFITFYSIGLGGALLSSVLIFLLFNILGISPAISKLITIPPVVLLQFFLNKSFSFNERVTK